MVISTNMPAFTCILHHMSSSQPSSIDRHWMVLQIYHVHTDNCFLFDKHHGENTWLGNSESINFFLGLQTTCPITNLFPSPAMLPPSPIIVTNIKQIQSCPNLIIYGLLTKIFCVNQYILIYIN